jgi:hypothetical protein
MVFERLVEKGDITYNFKKMCAYADDIIVIARNTTALKDVLLASETKCRKIWLRIN